MFGTGVRSRTAMFLVDSDYDTEDEEYGDDIEEILSGQIVNSVPSDDEHDDLCA